MAYKTPKELGISQDQFCALVKVRQALDEGRIEHRRHVLAQTVDGFNMSFWAQPTECGTVCCIAGWGEKLSKGVKLRSGRNAGLGDLFLPNDIGDWDSITPKRAVEAIDNYLSTGEPKWREVMAND